MQAAKAASCIRYGASLARDAVAVELLLTCSMRVANLVDLRVGESIRRFGEGRNGRWVIDIPGEKVKNGQPLRYPLLPESGRLLEEYLATWQPYWCGPGAPWLFPSKGGGHVATRLRTVMIRERARKYVGVRITCHQFRHLAAELYLQEDPMGLGVVSQHLGHRKFDTTRNYYAREQTRIATQRYHEVLIRKRSQTPLRRRRRQEPTGAPA
jgi:integrase